MEQVKLLIIGSGPAGYSAAIYAARAQLEPVMLAGEKQGGQLMLTTEVENYAGFSNGVLGPILMEEMRQQAVRFGTKVQDKYATVVDLSKRPFAVWTTSLELSGEELMKAGDRRKKVVDEIRQQQARYSAEAIILATGASARMLEVVGENEYIGRGVSYCAVCDAAFFRGKKVVLVGGGDAAMEDALALVKFAREVHLVVRSNVLRASKIMQERVLSHKKVQVSWNTQVKEVLGDGKKMIGVKLYQSTTQSEIEMEGDGLFVAIGHDPVTGFLDGQVILNSKGYVSTRLGFDSPSIALAQANLSSEGLVEYLTMTSVEGVFAAGDNVDFRYRQASTAAGMGTMAALDAIWWLERN